MEKGFFKNSSFYVGIQGLIKVISFVYTIFLARALGVDDFGLYMVALSYYALVSSISDFGISRYLIREIARDHDNLKHLVFNIIFFRLLLLSIFFAIFSVLMYMLDVDKMRVALTLLAIVAILPQTFSLTLDSIFIAKQKLTASGISLLVLNLANVILGVILVSSGFAAVGAISALIIGQVIYLAFLAGLAIKEKIRFKVHLSEDSVKKIFVGSLPYGFLGVLGLLYFKVDTLMLSYIKGDYETGIYGAAYRFIEAIIFIPSTVAVIIFPILAKLHGRDDVKVRQVYFSTLKIMFLLSVVITFGFVVILPRIIAAYLPAYLESIPVLYILAATIPFMFLHVPATQVLLSTDKFLKQIILLSILTVSFNIVLNLFLIPPFGVFGAAIVTVLSEILSFVVFFLFVRFKILTK